MKILYDYQIFSRQRYGGVSKYFFEIISHIDKFQEFELKVLAGIHTNEYIRQLNQGLVIGAYSQFFPKATKLRCLLNHQLSQFWLSFNQPQIIHETYYSNAGALQNKQKTVITVYDLIHEKFSGLISKKVNNFITTKIAAIKRADLIICISNTTKNDLLELYDVDPGKIVVIYLGVDFYSDIDSEGFSTEVLSGSHSPYILYVGNRSGYKNFDRFLKAYASKSSINKYFNLLCVGTQQFSFKEINQIRTLGLTNEQVKHVIANNTELSRMYQQASLFVYPSLYEGFGLPPLEAMSFNCPVACSNTGSLPEIIENAAAFFDPYNIDSMAEAMERVLFSNDERNKLIQLGQKRVKHFLWKDCAEQTMQAYSKLI